jgi:hypothetical protein
MSLRIPPRWRLVPRVLPIVALAAALKVIIDQTGGEGLDVNPLFTGLVAATVFLLGFLLAGTLADFKESERLPGELAASLESLADECQILYQDKQAPPARRCLVHLSKLTETLLLWFNGRVDTDAVLDDLERLNTYFLAFEPLTQPNFIVRMKQEQATIRRMVIRIATIRDTSFVGAGYVIAYITSAALVGALLFVEITPFAAALFFVCAIAFLLAYMIALIKDLDDPFEYGNGETGAAEVSLQPLNQVTRRLSLISGGLGELPPNRASTA